MSARQSLARRRLVDPGSRGHFRNRQLVEVAVQHRRAVWIRQRLHDFSQHSRAFAARLDRQRGLVLFRARDALLACSSRLVRPTPIDREPAHDSCEPRTEAPLVPFELCAPFQRDARDILRHIVGRSRLTHEFDREPPHPTELAQQVFVVEVSGARGHHRQDGDVQLGVTRKAAKVARALDFVSMQPRHGLRRPLTLARMRSRTSPSGLIQLDLQRSAAEHDHAAVGQQRRRRAGAR